MHGSRLKSIHNLFYFGQGLKSPHYFFLLSLYYSSGHSCSSYEQVLGDCDGKKMKTQVNFWYCRPAVESLLIIFGTQKIEVIVISDSLEMRHNTLEKKGCCSRAYNLKSYSVSVFFIACHRYKFQGSMFSFISSYSINLNFVHCCLKLEFYERFYTFSLLINNEYLQQEYGLQDVVAKNIMYKFSQLFQSLCMLERLKVRLKLNTNYQKQKDDTISCVVDSR